MSIMPVNNINMYTYRAQLAIEAHTPSAVLECVLLLLVIQSIFYYRVNAVMHVARKFKFLMGFLINYA